MEEQTIYNEELTSEPCLHTISEFYKNAWVFLKGKWLAAFLTSFISSAIMGLAGGVLGVILYVFIIIGILGAASAKYGGGDEGVMYTTLAIVFFVGILATYLFIILVRLFVWGPVTYGKSNAFLISLRNNKEVKIVNIFLVKKNYMSVVKVTGWSVLYITLWSLLFYIPGIIKAYSYSMIYYIQYDHPELTAKECLELSSNMMDGHKLDLFVLNLTFVGVIILGMFTCGITNYFAIPFMDTIMAQFYEDVKAKYEYFKGNMN